MSKIIAPPNWQKRIAKAQAYKPKRIVFCCPGNQYSDLWVSSYTRTLHALFERGFSYRGKVGYHPNIYTARNVLLVDMPKGISKRNKDIPWSGNLDYDYIMWIDSDMVWEPEQVFTLINHNKDIVTGITMTKPDICNCVELGDEDYELMKYDKLDGLTEVEACGFAFLLIKRGVFEAVGYPWFRPVFRYEKELETEQAVSEDLGFCILAREKGYKIYADPNIVLGHQKSVVLGGEYGQQTW